MKCLDPIAASTFADGQATAGETRAATAHVAICARCRDLVSALKQENLLLQEALRDLEPLPEKSAFRVGTGWALFGVLSGSLGIQLLIEQFTAAAPAGLEWAHPVQSPPWWQVLFETGFYLMENASEVAQMVTTIGLMGLIGTLFASGMWLARRRNLMRPLALMAMMATLLVGQGNAIEHRKAQVVVVAANETIHDTLIATGDSVNIDGTIEGDLIVMGRQATIRGTVRGNVISFTKTLEIEGKVEGSTFAFSQQANMRGETGRNAFVFTQVLGLAPSARIGSNLAAFASEIDMQAGVGKDAITFSDSLTVRGQIGRNLHARAHRVSVAAPANIGGDFKARVHDLKRVQVDEGVVITGKRDIQVEARRSRYASAKFYYWLIIKLIGAWLVGMALFWLVPALFGGRIDAASSLLGQLGRGFIICVATPIAAVLIALTMIGLPLGLITLVLWFIALYLAKIVVGAALGQALLPGRTGTSGFAVQLAAGLAVVFIATNLPYVGGFVGLLVALLGLGMAFDAVRGRTVRPTPTPAPAF